MELSDVDDQWSSFQSALRGRVSTAAWHTWLIRLRHHVDGDTVKVIAPNDFHLRWVQEKHGNDIDGAFDAAFGNGFRLEYVADNSPIVDLGSQPIPPGEEATDDIQDTYVADLPTPENAARTIDKYQFENFVVGQSNRFAYAAAMAVAENPGINYNPLFIYGGAGLGKTHLLNAIGHHARELYPGIAVRYLTSETFFTEFIDGIRRKRMDDFKSRYRKTDLLLLDDVQFFEGKEQILEEFFHTFNTLYESGKQMVISSDRPPRNLSTLEDRLRSRFEWGLLTDIQPPDIETRLAILRRHAEMARLDVPGDVLEFIAGLVSDNIRELEGSLTRVTAFALLTNQHIDLAMSERVLQDLLPGHEAKSIEPPSIIRACAISYDFPVDEVTGPSRRQPLAQCRQVAMYLCRELTDLSLPKIGALFGGRDHTTVLHAVEKITHLMKTDRTVFDRVSELSQSLRRT